MVGGINKIAIENFYQEGKKIHPVDCRFRLYQLNPCLINFNYSCFFKAIQKRIPKFSYHLITNSYGKSSIRCFR